VIEQLRDGPPVQIRPIRPDDKGLLSDGLRRLSDESVQRRFLTLKRSFSSSELRYLTEINAVDHVALVAEDPRDPARGLIAVGRFVRLAEDSEAAEIAIVVADDWQGRGVGSLVGRHLAHAARNRGIKRFTATMAAENKPAHRLMAKLTSHLEQRHAGAGVDELVLDLAA
jgi:RimJ/RimL family protein N-acetyltransferase